jgi:pyridoxamine-phosphate oxidase
MEDLSKMRQEYEAGNLNETEMAADPLAEFQEWMEAAMAAGLSEPNAMTLATATADGRPSARVVLLKEVTDSGFVFFTNYLSRKGRELIVNPYAALVFDWHDMERQVRVEGRVEKVPAEESDAYFRSRPENAKLGAWTSPQSKIIKNRSELDELQKESERKFAEKTIYRPAHWGGFLIRATVVEFWQGRPNRLHDRIVYYKTEEGWSRHRLAP